MGTSTGRGHKAIGQEHNAVSVRNTTPLGEKHKAMGQLAQALWAQGGSEEPVEVLAVDLEARCCGGEGDKRVEENVASSTDGAKGCDVQRASPTVEYHAADQKWVDLAPVHVHTEQFNGDDEYE